VVVLPATRDMCMMRKPSTLSANARFRTVLNIILIRFSTVPTKYIQVIKYTNC
jgi:hypothetical protein